MIGEIVFQSEDGTYVEVVTAEEAGVRCVKCKAGNVVALYRIEFVTPYYGVSHTTAYTPDVAAKRFDDAVARERRIKEQTTL